MADTVQTALEVVTLQDTLPVGVWNVFADAAVAVAASVAAAVTAMHTA